jgi:hypothetical protein
MLLKEFFYVVSATKKVAIIYNGETIIKQRHQFQWHNEHLLDLEVKAIGSEGDCLKVLLKSEETSDDL